MRFGRTIALVTLLAGCAGEASRQPFELSDAGESRAAGPARWEYAILHGNGGGNYTFMRGSDVLSNGSPDDFPKLYRALTGGGEPPHRGNRTAVLLEALGHRGWELIAVTRDELEFGRWYFKRRLLEANKSPG
jgi:hypothetical protein